MEYLNTHKQKTTCAQCGSNDFKSIDKSHIKCSHCGTQVDTTIKLTDANVNDVTQRAIDLAKM
ncbi:MAG TPA: hypothetical protein PLO32_06585, partial [Chitinophagales bacterium]|nr:hypothetical protein [Chitinophagales bacterium]